MASSVFTPRPWTLPMLAAGKKCRQPLMPEAKPGEEIEWARGGVVPSCAPFPLPKAPEQAKRKAKRRTQGEQQGQHPLVRDAREHFLATKVQGDEHLKPKKWLLVDLVVSSAVLDHALALANDLFSRLAHYGYDVELATRDKRLGRARVDPRTQPQKTDYYPRLWSPNRPTVAYFGTVAIGLIIFEQVEEVEVRWVNGKYVRSTVNRH